MTWGWNSNMGSAAKVIKDALQAMGYILSCVTIWGKQLNAPEILVCDNFNINKQICPFDVGETYLCLIFFWLEWNLYIPPFKSRTRKCNLRQQMRVTPLLKWISFKWDKSTFCWLQKPKKIHSSHPHLWKWNSWSWLVTSLGSSNHCAQGTWDCVV